MKLAEKILDKVNEAEKVGFITDGKQAVIIDKKVLKSLLKIVNFSSGFSFGEIDMDKLEKNFKVVASLPLDFKSDAKENVANKVIMK